jgi:hypothetical protein
VGEASSLDDRGKMPLPQKNGIATRSDIFTKAISRNDKVRET